MAGQQGSRQCRQGSNPAPAAAALNRPLRCPLTRPLRCPLRCPPSPQVLLDGPSPNQKKPGANRSHVGTASDPVRGTAALACKARLEEEGVACEVCESEQDYDGIRKSRQAGSKGVRLGAGCWVLGAGLAR